MPNMQLADRRSTVVLMSRVVVVKQFGVVLPTRRVRAILALDRLILAQVVVPTTRLGVTLCIRTLTERGSIKLNEV